MIEITLDGNVPSKKNSRIRTRLGSYIPNKSFMDWQNDAIKQLRMQCKDRFIQSSVCIDVTIIFGTKGRADLDNRLTSVLDMLVESMLLRDDKWQDVPEMSVRALYKKNQPGAIIKITPVPAVL